MFALTYHLRAALNLVLLALSLVCWALPVHLPPLLRMLLPYARWKAFWTAAAGQVFSSWMGSISWGIHLLLGIQWEVRGLENLPADHWYMVNPNHQT